jgi:hypothetical protein
MQTNATMNAKEERERKHLLQEMLPIHDSIVQLTKIHQDY